MQAITIREHTRKYAHKSDAMGALSLTASIAAYFLLLGAAGYFAGQLYISLPLIVILAFAMVRLYVLQHDCGHDSLFATKVLNSVAGYILSVFSLTPFRVMQYNHNQHHAYLGNLEHRETTEIFTMTLAEWNKAPLRTRLWYRLYRNPFIMLSLGGILTYFIAYRWPRNTNKVGAIGVVAHNLMVAALVGLIYLTLGWAGIAIWFASGVIAGVVGVFLVYLQHNFEETYWDKKPDLDFRKATLVGSSSLDLGHWWDIGTGNIAYHDLHHFNPGIPSYNLRHCQRDLPENLKMHDVIRWPQALASFKLRLWDEEQEKLVPFPKQPEARLAHPA